MNRALIIKELRETWWIGLLAGGVMLLFVLEQMGLMTSGRFPFLAWRQNLQPEWTHPVPFGSDDWPLTTLLLGAAAAVAMGLWQTLGESVQGTWALLLHRPCERRTIILSKLAAGGGCLLLCLGLPLLFYALWAATPGTHANPFHWWMAFPTVTALAFLCVSHLAAFLCGLRPARWWGSRFFPAVAVAFLWIPIMATPWNLAWTWLLLVCACVVLLLAILYVSRERDYA